jgi:hypothetical protein
MSARLRYLAATLALTAIVTGYLYVQRLPSQRSPRLEPRPVSTGRLSSPPALPSARAILDHGVALALSQAQQIRLETLDQRWQSEVGELETAVRQEQEAFSRFMQEAQAHGKTSVSEIQGRSANLRELSATLREQRQRHAEAAAGVLTEAQQQLLSGTAVASRQGGT